MVPPPDYPRVAGVDEYRRSLGTYLRQFRADEDHAPPVVFGNNRKPEAATLPYSRLVELERAEELVEDLALAFIVQSRREEPVVGSVADFLRAAGLDPAAHGVENE